MGSLSKPFDEMVQESWECFEEALVAHLRAEPTGCLRIERCDAAGDEVIEPLLITVDWDRALIEAALVGQGAVHDLRTLAALGWLPPESPEDAPFWQVALPSAEIEVFAAMTSGVLRHVFGVTDPAFLVDNMGLSGAADLPGSACVVDTAAAAGGDEVADARRDDGSQGASAEDADQERPTIIGLPDDAEDLLRMVEQALGVYGQDVKRDDDGDFPIRGGAVPIWVRVCEHSPVVRLFSYVVRSVRDTRQARVEVGILNRRTPLLKFTLEDGVIVATAELLAAPFVGPQLLNTLDVMCEQLSDLAADAALRVGGKLWFDEVDTTPS